MNGSLVRAVNSPLDEQDTLLIIVSIAEGMVGHSMRYNFMNIGCIVSRKVHAIKGW